MMGVNSCEYFDVKITKNRSRQNNSISMQRSEKELNNRKKSLMAIEMVYWRRCYTARLNIIRNTCRY